MFAEGGWFISHEKRPDAMAAVEAIEEKLRSHSSELKGKNLLRTPRGWALMREISKAVGQNGGVPYIHIVEKRYFVCSKIVETFFDPNFNPRVDPSETSDPEKRQADAQQFYDSPGLLVDQFAEAYRIKDHKAVKQNATNWIAEFSTHGRRSFAEKIEGVLPEIEAEIIAEQRADSSPELPSGLDSLNLPIVAEIFQFIEEHSPWKCEIVHDQTASFEAIYVFIFQLMARAERKIWLKKDGSKLYAGLKKACSLSFANSEKQPLIRAADYALAGARRFIELALRDEPVPTDIREVAFVNLGGILMETLSHMHSSLDPFPKLGLVMASSQWATKVFGRLGQEIGVF